MSESNPLKHFQVRKTNPQGEMLLGTQCADGVVTGCGFEAFHPLHYMHMDNDGNRAGWTSFRAPGVFQVKCGDTVNGREPGIDIHCLNGDINLTADNGRIRLVARDIDILANGETTGRGHVKIEANQDIKLKADGSFDLKAEAGYRLYTPHVGKIIANTEMKIVANFVKGLSCASKALAGKTDPLNVTDFTTLSSYTA